MRVSKVSGKNAFRKALQHADAFFQRAFEIKFAAHGALGDGRNLRTFAREFGEFVDAFLLNDRRIHVGDEEALLPVRGGLHDDVDRRACERGRNAFRERLRI
ncbi:MAG: hypothetical protein R3C55_04145 [Parvularculaceae bacterium]